jgi:hypothetical protein
MRNHLTFYKHMVISCLNCLLIKKSYNKRNKYKIIIVIIHSINYYKMNKIQKEKQLITFTNY